MDGGGPAIGMAGKFEKGALIKGGSPGVHLCRASGLFQKRSCDSK